MRHIQWSTSLRHEYVQRFDLRVATFSGMSDCDGSCEKDTIGEGNLERRISLSQNFSSPQIISPISVMDTEVMGLSFTATTLFQGPTDWTRAFEVVFIRNTMQLPSPA